MHQLRLTSLMHVKFEGVLDLSFVTAFMMSAFRALLYFPLYMLFSSMDRHHFCFLDQC